MYGVSLWCVAGVQRDLVLFGIEEVWTCVGTNLHVCGCWRGTHT